MLAGLFFTFWRVMQIITLIPTLGMLSYFVHQFQKANRLTPNYILVLFITSVLAAVWAIATLFRRKSTRRSAFFVSFIDLCFAGALIAGVFELRAIAKADCSHFSSSGAFSVTLDASGFSGNSGFRLNVDKSCAMLKACFAFGIMNIIFFVATAFLLLFMRRGEDKEVVVKETYRRRSHDSRRGHSRSGSGHRRRSSRDSRRPYFV